MTVTVKDRRQLETRCRRCWAHLAFELSDVQLVWLSTSTTNLEAGTFAGGVKCPDCGTVSYWSDCPRSVVERLRDAERANT